MAYVYPRNIFDDGDALLGLLGSFWSGVYAGRDQLGVYCEGFGRLCGQAYDAMNEAVDCLSRDTVPVYHRDGWRVVYARQSQVEAPGGPDLYSGSDVFGGGYAYGQTSSLHGYSVPVPGLADADWVFNRITDPSLSLAKGLDFLLQTDPSGVTQLVFRTDPFDDPRWASRVVFDANGNPADVEIALWVFRPATDLQFIYKHFGYVIGSNLPSSEGYKALVNAVTDSIVQGSAAARTDAVLEALTGVPTAKGNETVQAVGVDDRGLLVVTDANAYRLPAASTALVSVGDVLTEGQSLCDAYQVFELNRGIVPAGLSAISVGRGLLGSQFVGDLTFVNKTVPWVITSDPLGVTRVSFELSGFPADVQAFWDDVHARGVASGQTLADLIDVRGLGYTPPLQPTAASLPTTVNPLAFLVANVLRHNCVLVVIRAGSLPGDSPGLGPLRLLRRVLPPHTAFLVLVEMPPSGPSVTMAPADPGPGFYLGTAPFAEGVVAHHAWDGPPEAKLVSRTCQ